MQISQPKLKLKHVAYQELFTVAGLSRLDQLYLQELKHSAPQDYIDLLKYRQGERLPEVHLSSLLIRCAQLLESFIADLFGIQASVAALSARLLAHDPIIAFKQYFVLREAKRKLRSKDEWTEYSKLNKSLISRLDQSQVQQDLELAVAVYGLKLLESQQQNEKQIHELVIWCAHGLQTPEAQKQVQNWVSFKIPNKLDFAQLVAVSEVDGDALGRIQGGDGSYNSRDDFSLTDARMQTREIQDQANYCVFCHEKSGDFCAKGFPIKKSVVELGYRVNALEDTLAGCPLEERISEMQLLRKQGYNLAALAMVMLDNPMCPATGHRICNDCMKSCIYQKQDPVDIPQVETGVLVDVLALPWGVELYDLLTRWNPLRQQQWLPKAYTGHKVLVMGMGPAGFSLAHHLLMEGCAVVGMDGLKIEPLPEHFINQPVHDYSLFSESLNERLLLGFGGVAEYGITVRWDKNFLKLIYLTLLRRSHFQVFGGVRFGGSIRIEDAWSLGFSHVALAMGAGLPKEIMMPGSLAPGMRQANDFLMSLQLTGAAKLDYLACLQVRLPALVIGGGLTGIDTATEVQAYYLVQIEKLFYRYMKLVEVLGESKVLAEFDEAGKAHLQVFIKHAKAVREVRMQAAGLGARPNYVPLLTQWGGVTIVYRRRLQDSPAYQRNHQEVVSAFKEGIAYLECLEPVKARVAEDGYVESLQCRRMQRQQDGSWQSVAEYVELSAHAIFVATGSKPNIAYEYEHRGTFKRHQQFYQGYELTEAGLAESAVPQHCKSHHFGPFTSYQSDKHRVSYLGDLHPGFHGSVVKAIASAKQTYPHIMQAIALCDDVSSEKVSYQQFRNDLSVQMQARVVEVKLLNKQVRELVVSCPAAMRNFQPGQFFRIQNFASDAKRLGGTVLHSEALALPVYKVDHEHGRLSFLLVGAGIAERICSLMRVGDRVALMGPSGVRAKIPEGGERILLFVDASGVANACLLGNAMRLAGNQVSIMVYVNSAQDMFACKELEAAADQIIWGVATGVKSTLSVGRKNDLSYSGKLSEFIAYGFSMLVSTSSAEFSRILLYMQPENLAVFKEAWGRSLCQKFVQKPTLIASVYGPMQCMLKGICAQCLQWQVDADTGERTKAVFACSWQDQPMEIVDWSHLSERYQQNKVHESLNSLWIEYILQADS